MKRILVLALLVALVLACNSGSPEPTMYAPDDLASVLPTQVGDLTLEVEGSGGGEYLVAALGEDALTALTLCHNAAPCYHDRLHFALASSSSDPDTPRLVVFAVRVEDVGSWDLGPGGDDPSLGYPADGPYSWRLSQNLAPTPDEGWLFLYPYGEVLFGAIATSDDLSVTSEDVSAELPSCRRMDGDSLVNCQAPRL